MFCTLHYIFSGSHCFSLFSGHGSFQSGRIHSILHFGNCTPMVPSLPPVHGAASAEIHPNTWFVGGVDGSLGWTYQDVPGIATYPAGERRETLVALGLFLRFLGYVHPWLSERWAGCIQMALDAADKEVERLRVAQVENDLNHDMEARRARWAEERAEEMRTREEGLPDWFRNAVDRIRSRPTPQHDPQAWLSQFESASLVRTQALEAALRPNSKLTQAAASAGTSTQRTMAPSPDPQTPSTSDQRPSVQLPHQPPRVLHQGVHDLEARRENLMRLMSHTDRTAESFWNVGARLAEEPFEDSGEESAEDSAEDPVEE